MLNQHPAENALQLEFTFGLQAARRKFEQAKILLGGKNLLRASVKAGRRDALDEEFCDFFSGRRVHFAIEGKHAAKRGNRIAGISLQVSVTQHFLLGGTARIIVLDDDCRGLLKFGGNTARRFQIYKIVVGELFALKLPGGGQSGGWLARGNIQRRSLVRIFAIAEGPEALESDVHAPGQGFFRDERGVS